ncbi:MAG: FAD-linked oxidase C-terminal domain-containing protein [Arenicellales bacterium]|nr:FAD-linked oxidase C-terminal domain-containing protein [Arenicellales bacterium]
MSIAPKAENPSLQSQRARVASDLRRVVATDSVLDEEESLRPYECDGLSAYRRLPLVVVLPDTVDQVQQVVRYCHDNDIPIVARGAGTGLSGGALPIEDGVVLSLAKFNKVISVDKDNRTAVVQPGVRNLAISETVSHLGLYYAPDPSSQIACTIGGNVAENAGGLHCLKYGLTVHNVLEIKIVTIEGDLVTIGSNALDSPGYDLLALMTGSEGLLGIIVEVTVKLLTKPDCAKVIMASFDDIEKAGNAVANIITAGIIPGGLEMMDNAAIRVTEDFVHAGYDVEAAAILLCELDGTPEEVDDEIERVKLVLEQSGYTQMQVAKDDNQRQLFWSGRKSAFPAVGRISPDYYCMDGTIPRKTLGSVMSKVDELSRQYDLRVVNVFHAGDGNLHPLILYDGNVEGELERTEELGGAILDLCIEVGGTITGEHGVGMEKIDHMCIQFDTLELSQFHAVKQAFDTKRLLNPDKAVPTLHRCAEFGAMHVHKGQLKFPDIERF